MTERRTNMAKFRLSETENQQLEQLARQSGFATKAGYLRHAALEAGGGDAALAEEIGKLGLAVNALHGRVPASRIGRLAEAVCQLAEALAMRGAAR